MAVIRNTSFSILKAIAIILVVMGHSGAPHYLNAFAYMMHVPIFFICAGYFFRTDNLMEGDRYLKRRITGIYFPFVRWSVALLVLHNVWFFIGVLNEKIGADGGTLHPYHWHDFSQRLWSIVCNMSGYDEYIGGAFWFFRAFFIASLGLWIVMKILNHFSYFQTSERKGWGTVSIAFVLALWFVLDNLRMTGVAQGGYRELMGLFFMGIGFLYRQYEHRLPTNWKIQLCYAVLLILATLFWHSSMKSSATLSELLALPLPAIIGFLFWVNASKWIDRKAGGWKKMLIYIGDNTLYIFAFHILAFKLVSAIKIAVLGLSWEQLGAHPVIAVTSPFDPFFLLYTVVGIFVPLAFHILWRKGTADIVLPYDRAVTFVMTGIAQICGKLLYAVLHLGQWCKVFMENIRQIGRAFKDASNSDEE